MRSERARVFLVALIAALQAASGGASSAGGQVPPGAEDRDGDGDGVLDESDGCPDRAGLLPDGCPPRDSDGDGVADGADACADAPGPEANGGCPDADRDGDRVVDRVDQCADVPGRARFAGCPAPDRDRDGIADADDRCPDRAEIWNGQRDDDGCPDRGKPLLSLADVRTAVLAGRVFRSSGAPDSSGRRALAAVARFALAAEAREVRVIITAGKRADSSAEVVARRSQTVTRTLARALPGVRVQVDEVRDQSVDTTRVSLRVE